MKTVTGQVSITISPEDEKEIAIEYLCKEFGWGKDHFIEEGIVKRDVTNHTTHEWSSVETLREADQVDKAVDFIIRSLNL